MSSDALAEMRDETTVSVNAIPFRVRPARPEDTLRAALRTALCLT